PMLSGVGSESSIDVLIPAGMATLSDAAHLNTLSALVDLQRGDFEAARQRIGQNAAVALRLLETPTLTVFGYHMLGDDALSPLAAFAELEHRPEEARNLRAARAVLVPLSQAPPSLAGSGLAVDLPDLSRLSSVVLRGPQPLGDRVALLL